MTNPYGSLPDRQFWRRSIGQVEPHRVDPVTAPRFRLGAADKVITAGSCFAQHIAARLIEIGRGFHVAEAGEHLPEQERRRHGYGVFSARSGNIYTVAQMRQLLDEALCRRTPLDRELLRPDGRLVDPWRQQIEPDGFATQDALRADRARHLAAVRAMFEEADVFIFTLGLTEGWRARADGSVYSAAPGVIAGTFDPDRDEFVNFGIDAVREDLFALLATLREINAGLRVILTVSPVPLIATFEPRSVLVSTSYSKAVLRVAADEALRRHDWVDYFPSYEIITGSFSGGLYYEDDGRSVNRLGVAHAMRCFTANFIDQATDEAAAVAVDDPANGRSSLAGGIVCDEEALDTLRQR